MFTLTQKIKEKKVTYEGHTIEVNFSFDSVIKCIDIAKEELFDEVEKTVIMFRVLVKNYQQYSEFNIVDRENVVNLIFQTFMEFKNIDKSENVIDFSEDAERIYVSFLQVGIDLQDEIGTMDWTKFIAIFNNLPEDSPIVKVIGYRVMTVPTEKEVGKKERKRLIKLKKLYELPEQKAKREEQSLKALENLRRKGRR